MVQHSHRSESPLSNENSIIIESMSKACRYSPEEKKERIERYRSKRNQRNFNKKIKVSIIFISCSYLQTKKVFFFFVLLASICNNPIPNRKKSIYIKLMRHHESWVLFFASFSIYGTLLCEALRAKRALTFQTLRLPLYICYVLSYSAFAIRSYVPF